MFEFPYRVDLKMSVEIYKYYTLEDLAKSLGGIKAAAGPFFDLITPFAIFYFFYSVAGIIKE